MTRVLVVHPDGRVRLVDVDGLNDLQRLCRGYIQTVPTPTTDLIAYCNEEGRLEGLAPNPTATAWWHKVWTDAGHDPEPGHDLLGPVVILGQDGSSTEVDVPAHVVESFGLVTA